MPDDHNPPPVAPGRPLAPPAQKDKLREVIDTIVVVAVLVSLVKPFLADTFFIPSESMATTILGYHHEVTCPKCGYSYLVNARNEASPEEPPPLPVVGCTCPNCEYTHPVSRGFAEGVP
jgi:hypothetical protein